MKVIEKMIALLEEHGLTADQSAQVMHEASADELLKPMSRRWNDDVSGYPASVIDVTWTTVRDIAAKWVAARFPEHFAIFLLEAT